MTPLNKCHLAKISCSAVTRDRSASNLIEDVIPLEIGGI